MLILLMAAQGQSGSPMIEHRIFMPDSSSTTVCINCTFLDSSTTHCVIVVHQRISQLMINSSGLMNIESSHILNRTGNTAYGCIEGINMTNYQVGVFGIRLEEKEIDGIKFLYAPHETNNIRIFRIENRPCIHCRHNSCRHR